ncbi:MAG: gliding motility-associated C-terminal domain-containing protein, partial [Bacteroidetes bacterium]|nr:gliding motility-associated C-terminal domain-containing protein [Fibrella sp.]
FIALCLVAGLTQGWAQTGQLPRGISVTNACVPNPSQECKSDSTQFTDSTTTATAWLWNFGDAAGGANTATTRVASHLYQTAGFYEVQLTRTLANGQRETVQIPINVGQRPSVFSEWRTDTTICKGQTIKLDPYPGGAEQGLRYKWFPKGQTTQTLDVDSSGCYSVEVTNSQGCTYQDRINVDVCGEQKESQGVKWYFGSGAGLDFQGGGSPQPLDDGKLNTIEGSSSIANTKGQLLFYSDGITIYDKDGTPMKVNIPGPPRDTSQAVLQGSQRSTQSALIVPKPTCQGCEYLYYVYTTSEIRGTKQLTYSIVDMRENNGNGAVVARNIPVSSTPSTEQSASVRNDRDSTYWVITHDFGTNCYRVNHLTESENKEERRFCVGPPADSLSKAEGYIKIGPADTASVNRAERPLAVVSPGPPQNSVNLFTFNDSTGVMTFNRTLNLGPAPPKAYGAEFSPDGKTLYVSFLADTSSNGRQSGFSYVVKYDLSQKDSSLLAGSRTVVDSSSTRQYGALQLGADGRIYVAVQGATSLGVIENPDGGLLDSLRFNPTGQSLGGKTSQLGLPNQVANFNEPSNGPSLTHADTCANSPTTFEIGPNCPKLKETYTITFGDGSAPVSTTSAQPQTHTYTRPGSYTATLRIVTMSKDGLFLCKDTTIYDPLTIIETPSSFTLGPDREACGRDLTLDIPVTATIYVWVVNGAVVSRQKQLIIPKNRYGSYQVIGFAANGGCFNSDTINVLVRRPPTLDLGPDSLLCQGTTYTLTVPQRTWETFQWSNGVTTRDNPVTRAGTYTVTAQNNINNVVCENSDTISLTEAPKPQLRATLSSPANCTSTNGAIDATASPTGSYTYVWSNVGGVVLPNTTNRIDNLTIGTYRLRATSDKSCTADSAFTLIAPATTSRGPDRQKCISIGDTLVLSPTDPTIAGSVYQWSTGDSSRSISISASGTYTVLVRNNLTGCADRQTIQAVLTPKPIVSAGLAVSLCAGTQPIPLTGNTPGGGTWSGPNIDPTGAITPLPALAGTTITAIYSVTQNGCENSAARPIAVKPVPTVNAGPDATFCDNTPVPVVASGSPGSAFRWSNGTLGSRLQPGTSGNYIVTANLDGCERSDTLRVVVNPSPQINVPGRVPLCEGNNGSATLTATGSGTLTYAWSPLGQTTNTVTVRNAGRYTVRATNQFNCVSQAQTEVVDQCEPMLLTTTAFTPNNDGRNDTFEIVAEYITDFDLKIYNRWGEVIFSSTSPDQKWDGNFRGEPYPPMNYAFVVSYKSQYFPERPRVTKRGSVLLIR